jgi:hypothetical protein
MFDALAQGEGKRFHATVTADPAAYEFENDSALIDALDDAMPALIATAGRLFGVAEPGHPAGGSGQSAATMPRFITADMEAQMKDGQLADDTRLGRWTQTPRSRRKSRRSQVCPPAREN